MSTKSRDGGWLPNFRRALAFVRPHRRPLIMGLLAAVGVSVFYTFSISTIVPVLKIIFAEHESLVDWLQRAETQRRLGIVVPADIPDDPNGLVILTVRAESPARAQLNNGDRLTAIGGVAFSAYALSARLAQAPGTQLDGVSVVSADGTSRVITLPLTPHQAWWPTVSALARWLPAGETPAGRYRTLFLVMVLVVVFGVIGGAFRFLNDGLVAIAVQRALHDLRTALADHALRMPMDWHSTQPPGDTLARFANDIDKVLVGFSTLFGKVIREPLKAVGVLTVAAIIDWRMLIIGVVGAPIGAVVIRTFGRLVKRAQRRASQSWGRLLDHLGERLAGIRVVKACNMQSAESHRFELEGRELTRAQTHIELVDAASNPVLELLATVAISGFILYGGWRVFNNQLEPHLFFGAVICLGGIFDPMRKLGNVNNRLQAAEASARRLFEVMEQHTEEVAAPVPRRELPAFREAIEFRGVSFAYTGRPDHLVLRGIDLTVHRGQVVALVGPNGSGKTTLMSLLLRFFAPTRGAIYIDGADIADVSLNSLRQQIGLVTQDAIVFSDTLRANIAYGANGAADDAIQRAARLAHVDEFIPALQSERRQPLATGYDAAISARTLSGGQRQRIALARAILRDPPILILDEATSQVDSESERKIQQALEDVMRDRTTFIVAHRFSTIARADVTVVLNEGQIVATGRHADLLESCPFYVTLVRTQFAHGV